MLEWWTIPPAMAAPDPIPDLLKAVNEASGKAFALWVMFLTVGTYLAIAIGTTTHLQLLLAGPVKLPLLGVARWKQSSPTPTALPKTGRMGSITALCGPLSWWLRSTIASKARSALSIVRWTYQAGRGMFKGDELERLYRDVRCGRFHPANAMTVHEVVGKSALGVLGEAGPCWG